MRWEGGIPALYWLLMVRLVGLVIHVVLQEYIHGKIISLSANLPRVGRVRVWVIGFRLFIKISTMAPF